MTLDVLRLAVTKDLLRSMAKEERALFLALGHASNQVNALWKLVIVLTNGSTNDSVKQRLEGAQTQVFVRLTGRDVGGVAAGRGAFPQALLRT